MNLLFTKSILHRKFKYKESLKEPKSTYLLLPKQSILVLIIQKRNNQ